MPTDDTISSVVVDDVLCVCDNGTYYVVEETVAAARFVTFLLVVVDLGTPSAKMTRKRGRVTSQF